MNEGQKEEARMVKDGPKAAIETLNSRPKGVEGHKHPYVKPVGTCGDSYKKG